MNLRHYPLFESDDHLTYSFYSIGPRGKITKLIRYEQLRSESHLIFNLSLGDIDAETKQIREDVVSGNKDKDRIFVTVAKSIERVFKHYPHAYIQIRGNSMARNRLYQMTISAQLEQILLRYEVYGLVGQTWRTFRPGQRFEGFLLHVREK